MCVSAFVADGDDDQIIHCIDEVAYSTLCCQILKKERVSKDHLQLPAKAASGLSSFPRTSSKAQIKRVMPTVKKRQ